MSPAELELLGARRQRPVLARAGAWSGRPPRRRGAARRRVRRPGLARRRYGVPEPGLRPDAGRSRAGPARPGSRLRALARTVRGDALGQVGDDRRGRHPVEHGTVQRGGRRGGHVHGVHGPVRCAGCTDVRRGRAALGQRLHLGLVRVVAPRGLAAARGRAAPAASGSASRHWSSYRSSSVVPLAVPVVLPARGRVDDPEPGAEQPQPLRDGVDGGRGDDQQAEDA